MGGEGGGDEVGGGCAVGFVYWGWDGGEFTPLVPYVYYFSLFVIRVD